MSADFTFRVRLPSALHAALMQAAEAEGSTASALTRRAIYEIVDARLSRQEMRELDRAIAEAALGER